MQFQRALKSVIKPVLRGETLVVGNGTLTEVTISAVDMTKVKLNILGCRRLAAALTVEQFVEVDLKNSTTIRFRRGHPSPSSLFDIYVSWELVEYV